MRKPLTYAPIHLVEGEQGNGKSTTIVARVVDAYRKDPTIKIYANFHLYGIRYVYLPLPLMLEYLNSGLIQDGYLLIDEAYISGDAREGMTAVVKMITKMANQMRKRHLHLYMTIPNAKMIDWRYRWAVTEKIMCINYNERTHEITLLIKNKRKSRKPRKITYDGSQYWKYHDTDEILEIPQTQIAKALAGAR